MNCPQCRQALNEEARFCSRCGLSTAQSNTNTKIIDQQVTTKYAGTSDPLIGRVLDSKYELVARLGEGGMGTVYRARRLHIGDEVAVKVLHQQFVRQRGGIERFRREAHSAALIRHANVVTIHDFSEQGSDDAAVYIVMELVRGISLRDLLRQEGRLAPERAVALMRDICAGVGMAHRQGIVHRDLKPDNVIVVPPDVDGEREMAKVLDFGLAKLRDIVADFSLTQAGAVMGTPYYMSPEQWQGESLDARADVYSLGAMLYEMLTDSPPFRATSITGLMAKHLHEAPPAFAPNLEISLALGAVCRKALSKNPDERPADAAELSRELQAALATPAISEPSPSVREPTSLHPVDSALPQWTTPREEKSNRVKWVVAGLLTLLIGTAITAMAILYLTRDEAANHNVNTTNPPDRKSSSVPDTTSNGNSEAVPNIGSENASPATGGQDLKGAWTGTYGPSNQPATLLIKDHKGSRWSGVLEQGAFRIAFTGSVDASSLQVRFQETRVLSGSGWSLGRNTGELSPDGREMSGTGKDAFGGSFGISYEWSFSKQ
jgi:eukaryotic-like serine/threonine-protein kinase